MTTKKRKNSRDKGARGERELAAELQRLFGVDARRGVQYHGGADSPDVVSDFGGIHFEVKRAERISLYPAMKQAINDAGGKIPVVCHRQNREEWLVIVRLADLPRLIMDFFMPNCDELKDELDSVAFDPSQDGKLYDWICRKFELEPGEKITLNIKPVHRTGES